MTIATETSTATYLGNGTTTVFNFSFVGASASDLEVIYVDSTGTAVTVNPSLYTVYINPTSSGQLWGVGGTVTYPIGLTPTPIAAGTTLTINRIVPYTQSVTIDNQGAFYPQAVEEAMDLLELQIQQVETGVGFAIRAPLTDPVPPNVLPSAPERANGFLAFDSAGQPIISTGTGGGGGGGGGGTSITYTFSTTAALLTGFPTSPVLSNGTTVLTGGRTTEGDLGGGVFYYVSSDTTTADNGGTIRVDTNGRRWYWAGTRMGVRLWGAYGLGASGDDTAAFQNAVNWVSSIGGGTVFVEMAPVYYNITYVLQMKNNVSIIGDAGYPKIKNLASSETPGLEGEIFLPGNFHPAFTQDVAVFGTGSVYYPTNSVTAGDYSVALTNSGDAAHFSVGDQVFVTSTAYTTVGGFGLPNYAFLNTITNKSGTTLTLRYPLDTTMTAKIMNCAANMGRDSIPLFFWENGSLQNLDIQSSSLWVGDTACKSCLFQNNHVEAAVGSYGNTYQDCDWLLNTFYWSFAAHEQSHNSLRTRTSRNRYIFKAMVGVTETEGFYFQERSRYAFFQDNECDFGNAQINAFAIQIYDAQDTNISRNKFSGKGFGNFSWLYFTTTAGDAFVHSRNIVEDNDINISSLVRYVHFNGASDASLINDRVSRNRFAASTDLASDAIKIDSVIEQNTIDNNRFEAGQIQLDSTSNMIITDNYIDGGWVDETGNNLATLQNNVIRRNTEAKTLAKQIIRNGFVNQVFIAPGVTQDFYTANVGANMQFWDVINWEMYVYPEGTASTRQIVLYLYDNTTSTETDLCTLTIAANASASVVQINGRLDWLFSAVDASLVMFDPTNGLVSAISNTNTPTSTDNLDIRIKGIAGSGDAGILVLKLNADYSNPWTS